MFLVAGLVIMAALLVLFGGLGQIAYLGPIGIKTGEILAYNITGASLVGPEDVDAHKKYDLDLNISYIKGTEIYPLESMELSNGLFFGSNSIKYNLKADGIDSITVSFRIVRTNSYAPLIVKINNEVVHEQVYYPGYASISIDEGLSDDMLIEIEAASSGWQIWAPTVYSIEDVELEVKSYLLNTNEFKFTLMEEYDNFDQGRIDIQLDENMGDLIVEMNNRIIYSDVVSNYKTIEFNKTRLRSGENILAVKAGVNSLFVGSASLLIFYKTEEVSRIETILNLTESQYNSFDQGKIRFTIVDLIEPGGVSAKIMYGDEAIYSEYKTASTGSYEFTFSKASVRQGENKIIIESIDDAVFLMKEFRVSY